MKSELTRLNDEHDSARATLQDAQKDFEHTKHALTESDSLLVECDQHQIELEQLTADIETMELLRDEWKQRRGLEIAQLVRESIESAHDYQRQVKEVAEARLLSAIERIESELAEWPELIEGIAEAFRESVEDGEENPGETEEVGEAAPRAKTYEEESEQTSNPTVKLCLAWITFLQALREHGPQSKRFINGVNLIDTLSLQPGRMMQFMQPANWRYVRERDSSGRETYRWDHNDIEW